MDITEDAYVVICPDVSYSTTQTQGFAQTPIMYFKIGTHSNWDGSKDVYIRCNPNCMFSIEIRSTHLYLTTHLLVWYRSFRIKWVGTSYAGQANDLIGFDGPKQILTRIFESSDPNATQTKYKKVNPQINTEWWYTTDTNCIASLRTIQNNWDHQWQSNSTLPTLTGTIQFPISPGHMQNATIGTVRVAVSVASNGLEFSYRNGAVAFFKTQLGIASASGSL